MKYRSRTIHILLALALAVMPIGLGSAHAEARLRYDNNDDKLTLVNAQGAVNVTIPAEVQGYPVVEIGQEAFLDSPDLRRVVIPASINEISTDAFSGCYNLTEIAVDEGNASYSAQGGALLSKDGGTVVLFAQGVSGEANMPQGIKRVREWAFEHCWQLTEIRFENGLSTIGEGAFDGCDALQLIVLPESVTSIGEMNLRSTTKIQCVRGSAADDFAAQNGLEQVYMDPATGMPEDDRPEEEIQNLTAEPTPPTDGESDENDLLPEPAEPYLQILAELDDPLIGQTYEHLRRGSTINRGDKDEQLQGLQQLLNLLGAELTVDGSIGAKSIAALNSAQQTFGLEQTGSVSQADYEQLLLSAYIVQRPDQAAQALGAEYDDQIRYVTACAASRDGNNFTASQLFLALGDYRDSAARAQACVISWPKNGQIYRNDEYGGSAAKLTVEASRDDEQATYFKAYAEDGSTLVAGIFIAGTGQVSINLPSGTYLFKTGVGTTWYGPNEAFGRDNDSSYQRLTFDGGEDRATLKSGYQYTLTLGGASEGNVGSTTEGADDF